MSYASRLLLAVLFLCTVPPVLHAGYTTPNTQVQWTADSLVANSGGVVTGAFPLYTVTDSVIIAASDRLTLRAGTTLRFTQRGLYVRGQLSALGTPDSLIIFTATTAAPNSWKEIYFEDSSLDSACVLDYCLIEYSDNGVRCVGSSPTITHSTFRFNRTNAIRLSTSNAVLRYDSLYSNVQTAMNVNLSSSPTVEFCVFANNNTENISFRNQLSVGGQGANNPVVRGCEFYNNRSTQNRAGAISLTSFGGANSAAGVIENNYLHDNSYGILCAGLGANANVKPLIRNNRIENNSIYPDVNAAGSGISCYGTDTTVAPVITGNRIVGNFWGITLPKGTGQYLCKPNLGDLTNSSPDDNGRNSFIDNGNGGTIYALYNDTPVSISAQNNYWGTSNPDTAAVRIFGQNAATNPLTVNFLPVLSGDESLPVELLHFTASATESGVRLNWTTASETNNLGFEVERAPAESDAWKKIGFVDGAGTTTEETAYSFIDRASLSTGTFFYRLKQLDFDGKFSYSPEVKAAAGVPQRFSLSQNYPNPFNPETAISYQLSSVSEVSLKVYDLLGREVQTLVNERQSAGKYSVRFQAGGLASGVYFYRLSVGGQGGGFRETKKMTVIK